MVKKMISKQTIYYNWPHFIVVIVIVISLVISFSTGQFENLIWGIISSCIVELIAGANSYRLSRLENEKTLQKYIELNKKAKYITPKDLRVAKYNECYLKRSEDKELLEAINNNENALIVGMPQIGKTRAVYEAIIQKEDFNIIKFWEKPIQFEEIPDDIFKVKTIIFLDDLNNFVKKLNLYELIKKIKEKNEESLILATCRTGDEYEKVKEEFSDILRDFKIIEMEIVDTISGGKIAEKLNTNLKKFDGTPGSLILELESMENRHSSLPNECKIIFRKLKLLHEAGTISPYTHILKALYVRHIQEQRINISLDFESALKKLLDNSFVLTKQNKEQQIIKVWHETYFDFVDYKFNLWDFKWLQNIQIQIKDSFGLFSLGNSFLFKKLYNDAIESYDKVLEINSNEFMAWANKGISLAQLKKYDNAIASLDKAVAINQNFSDAWYNKGIILSNIKKYNDAIESYDKCLKINPTDFRALNNRGISLANLKKYDDAVASLDKALKINQTDFVVWYNKGRFLADNGKYKEAVESYNKALEINPNDYMAWNNRGMALEELREYDEAIKSLDKALKFNPLDFKAWNNRGTILSELGKYDEAIESYDKCLKINPKHSKAWYNRSYALNIIKKYKEAIKSIDKAIEINSNDFNAWAHKGISLVGLKRYDEAIESLDKCLELNPNDLTSLNLKGAILSQLERYEEAIKIFDKCLEINPEFVIALEYKKLALEQQSMVNKANE